MICVGVSITGILRSMKRAKTWLNDWMIMLGLRPYVDNPSDLKWSNWKTVFHETRCALSDKNLGVLAAGVAYFATLSFFPMMVAMVSISVLFIKPEQLQGVVAAANTYLPQDIAGLITTQLTNLIDKPSASLIAGIIALVIALWGISGAVENLIRALNTAYGVRETRGFIQMKARSLIITVSVIVLMMVFVPLMGVTEDWLIGLGISPMLVLLLSILRWVLLIIIVMIALAMLYHHAPNRARPKWRWVSWGAIVATALWIVATGLFFIYARYFAHFSDAYSLFAGIIVLMTWFNLSALTILIGAEVNYNLERQTASRTHK